MSINNTIITAKRCENDSHNSCASIALPSSFASSSSMGRHSPSAGYSYYYEWTPLGINVNHCVRWPLNLLECVVLCIGHWCSELLPIRIIYIYWHLKTNISHNSTYYTWIDRQRRWRTNCNAHRSMIVDIFVPECVNGCFVYTC